MKMTKNELNLIVPYFTKNTVGEVLAERFSKLRAILEKNDALSVLNQETVTGVWYLAGLNFEDNCDHPQIIVRSPIPADSYDRMVVEAAISGCLYANLVYDYDEDYIGGDAVIQGSQNELFAEVKGNRVYTIFDKERI